MSKLRTSLLLAFLLSGSVFAEDIKIVGTLTQHVHPTVKLSKSLTHKRLMSSKTKDIVLLKIQLSETEKQRLSLKAKQALSLHSKVNTSVLGEKKSKLPGNVQLGMNDVPVLDQGPHGSCVTFAVSAAIDALLNNGDYISQLCQLQLGNYLEMNGYQPSGWEGSLGRKVLAQMETFGFVTKDDQENNGCGGLTSYPADDPETPTSTITPEAYRQMSHALVDPNEENYILWDSIFDINQAVFDRRDPQGVLDEVKSSLNAGDRLAFGVLLWDVDLGVAGAVGSHVANFDTWVLTPEIARDVYLRRDAEGGHEMVITGYDDNAVAIDDKGREHQGLLTIRNSWGTSIGNRGDFYMTYDYFKMFVIEVDRIRIRTVESENASH